MRRTTSAKVTPGPNLVQPEQPDMTAAEASRLHLLPRELRNGDLPLSRVNNPQPVLCKAEITPQPPAISRRETKWGILELLFAPLAGGWERHRVVGTSGPKPQPALWPIRARVVTSADHESTSIIEDQ